MCIKLKKVQKKFVLTEDHAGVPSILSDLKLLMNILKTAGLFPIYTQLSDSELEPPSKANEFYTNVIRLLIHSLTAFTLYNVFQQNSLDTKNRETDNINNYIEILISIATYTGVMVLCSKHSNMFLKMFNETLKIDLEIRERYGQNVRNHCEFCTRTVYACIFCQLFVICVKFNMDSVSSVSQYAVWGIHALQNLMCCMCILFLISCLRVISMRFVFVNVILANYMYNMGGIRCRGAGYITFEGDVAFTFRLHNKLLSIYKMLNESCSLLVAFFMGYSFYTITTNTYNIFVEFTTNHKVSVSLLLNCFAWLILNTALLTMLTQGCGQATKQANNTSQILARVYGKSKDYQNIIDKFLTKSIRQDVQFTAYGFFVVDNSTLFKIFSAVTTYLVILIQFKQLEDTKLDESLEANKI